MQKDNLFFKACQNGQKGIVASFLKTGNIDINAKNNEGYTALHFACHKGTRDIVRMLIEKGADVNLSSNKGMTPLHVAVSTGSKDIIRMLVEAGADINATDHDGESAVIYAIRAEKSEVVNYLQELGADVSLTDNKGRNAMDYANVKGLAMVMDVVAPKDINQKDSFGNTPLHQACYNGHGEMVKRMLDKPDIDVDVQNDVGETPLYIAVRENNLYIAELLLNAGADVNRVDSSGQSLLHVASQNHKLYMVDALIRRGADVNACNNCGATPLICAVKLTNESKGSIDIVKLLLDCNADVTCADMWGKKALDYAVEANNEAIVEVLLEAGAEV